MTDIIIQAVVSIIYCILAVLFCRLELKGRIIAQCVTGSAFIGSIIAVWVYWASQQGFI